MWQGLAHGSVETKGGRDETAGVSNHTLLKVLNLDCLHDSFVGIVAENVDQPRSGANVGISAALSISRVDHIVYVTTDLLASDKDDILDDPVGRDTLIDDGGLGAADTLLIVVPSVHHFAGKVKEVVALSVVVVGEAVLKHVVSHGRDGIVPPAKVSARKGTSLGRPANVDAPHRRPHCPKAGRGGHCHCQHHEKQAHSEEKLDKMVVRKKNEKEKKEGKRGDGICMSHRTKAEPNSHCI